MTDVAAGGQAALQLQQTMAAAPDVKQAQANTMEMQGLKLQEAQAKIQQDAATLEKTKLANLVADSGFKSSQESKAKLRELAETPEFKEADDAGKLRLSAAAQFQNADIENGVKTLAAAELYDSRAIATRQKQLDQTAQQIGNAYGVIAAVPNDRVDEFINRLPEENKKALISQVGEDNWNSMTGTEKKEATKNLMLNAKGQMASQLRQIEAQKQILINESRERVAKIREDGRIKVKAMGNTGGGGTDRTMLDWNIYNKAIENVDRSGRKSLERLNEAVDAADVAQEKSKIGTFYNSSEPTEKTRLDYTKAVEARDNFQRSQIKKQINLTKTAPNFPGKQAVLDNLAQELELFGEVTPIKIEEEKPSPAPTPTATKPTPVKAEVPATTKPSVPSNKPPAKLTQEQNNAAITKANEAIKNGADPEKVKARLKEAGVSFKE
jgi:hypothetical protein